MKFAIFGDIHANLDALQVCLEDMKKQGVTHHVCMGDIVGYNANPSECLEIIRELNCPVVRGNHDHYCGYNDDLSGFHPMAAAAVDWTRQQLSEDQREYLRNLPFSRMVETFTIVHSTLDAPENWGYVFDKFDAEANFNYQSTNLCFFGHTHVPIIFEKSEKIRAGYYEKIKIKIGRKYFINVGSVGQPRDGNPKCGYVIFDGMNNTVELRRLDYDIEAQQKKIIAAGLPQRLADRLAEGR